MTDNELVFGCQGWPDPELDWWVCSYRCWVVLQGTKTPATPSETRGMAGTSHPSHAREGIWYRTGIPALLSRVRNSSSAEHCSKDHQWDPVAKAGWEIPVGRDRHTDTQQSPVGVRVAGGTLG